MTGLEFAEEIVKRGRYGYARFKDGNPRSPDMTMEYCLDEEPPGGENKWVIVDVFTASTYIKVRSRIGAMNPNVVVELDNQPFFRRLELCMEIASDMNRIARETRGKHGHDTSIKPSGSCKNGSGESC